MRALKSFIFERLTFLKLSSLCLLPQKYIGMLTHHNCRRVRKALKISVFLVYERLPRFERGLREILWTIWRPTLSPESWTKCFDFGAKTSPMTVISFPVEQQGIMGITGASRDGCKHGGWLAGRKFI